MKFSKDNTNFYHYLSGGYVLHQDEQFRVGFRTISGELVEIIGVMTTAELNAYDSGYTNSYLYRHSATNPVTVRVTERFPGRFFAEIPVWDNAPAILYLGTAKLRDTFVAGYDKGRQHRLQHAKH